MKDLADRLLIVIGGATGNVRNIARAWSFLGLFFGGNDVGNLLRVLGRGGEKVWCGRGARGLLVFFVDVERFLDRRQRSFGRVVRFFRVIGQFGRRLECYACPGRPAQLQKELSMERSDMIFRPRRSACSVIVRSLRDSPKKPHAAPPAVILSIWQIKENRSVTTF